MFTLHPALLSVALAATPPPLPEPVAPSAPVLRTTAERFWTLSLRFRAVYDDFGSLESRSSPTVRHAQRETRFDLGRGVVIVPMLEGTSLSTPVPDAATASLRFDGRVVDDTPTLLPGYQAGERLARLDAQDVENADDMEVWLDLPMRSRSVAFDEARASAIAWPAGPWPAIAASALTAQLGIDPEDERVVAMAERVLGPKPYADPPVVVAKRLAAAVIDGFQPSGLGFEYDRAGRFAGLELCTEDETSERLTGSPADMAALYSALLRAAGVPARPVVGYNLFAAPEGVDEGLDYLTSDCGVRFRDSDASSLPRLTFWVEIALYDEPAGTLEWVPVDVFAQRRLSSRSRPLDQPWKFFGSNPCGEALLPISHHFFPPTTVVGMGAPLFWGWMAEPELPRLSQTLRIWAQATPVTTEDD